MKNDCWNAIGVWGDLSCPELKTHTHCRNCPVYSTGGRSLLERSAPEGYVNEWTNLLAQEKVGANDSIISAADTISVVIFRLGVEWLALPAKLFKEVTPPSAIHTLPHRSNSIFLGLANVRGEIQMCISLIALLGVETADTAVALNQNTTQLVYKRMVVVEKEGNRWVFAVDEIYGVHHFHPDKLRNVPAVVSKSINTYTKEMINFQNKNVCYLDDELLFYTIAKKVL